MSRRGSVSPALLGMGTGLTLGVVIDALILFATVGVSVWGVIGIAAGGAVVGGLVIFFHNKLWGNLMLRKLAQIERQFGTVADETSIVSGELYQLRAEVSSIRRALNVPPPGANPPPAPTAREQP